MQITFRPKNCPFEWEDLDPHLTHGSLGQPESTAKNGISIGSAVFAELKLVIDLQTDRPRYSICNNRPHLHGSDMRPNNEFCNIHHHHHHVCLLMCRQNAASCKYTVSARYKKYIVSKHQGTTYGE